MPAQLARIVVHGRHPYQRGNAPAIKPAQLRQLGQQHRHAGCPDPWNAAEHLRQFSVMLLYVVADLAIAIVLFGLQEGNVPLNAGTGGRVRQPQTMAFSGEHLHDLSSAQHQGL